MSDYVRLVISDLHLGSMYSKEETLCEMISEIEFDELVLAGDIIDFIKIPTFTKKTINSMIVFIDDDGPGIPEKEYQNVLKPFYRIDKSRGLNKSGVGLGLSIANDIIRAHGGNISLEKRPLDGLIVKISLPL